MNALDASSPLIRIAVIGHGGDAYQGGDLTPVETSELWQLGDQCRAGCAAGTIGRLHQSVELAELLAHMADIWFWMSSSCALMHSSGYCAWKAEPASPRTEDDQRLLGLLNHACRLITK